jgi:hypothetical protein
VSDDLGDIVSAVQQRIADERATVEAKRIDHAKRSRRGTLAAMSAEIAAGFASQPGYCVNQISPGDEFKIAEFSVRIARKILQRIDEVER